jgi:hypothetical protein
MTIGNATWLEIVWTLTGVIGLLVNLWALNDSLADMRWQEAAPMPDRTVPNGEALLRERQARERIARGNARDETLRSVIQLVIVMIGIVAMATAPVNPGRAVSPLSWVFAVGLVTVQMLLVIKAVMARRDRHWINRHTDPS